jgi:hypothetical protein
MGGEGSMLAMIQAIKNNRELLRRNRKGLFSRKVKHSKGFGKNPQHHEKHLSKEQILEIRSDIKSKTLVRNFKIVLIMLLISIVVGAFIYFVFFEPDLIRNHRHY